MSITITIIAVIFLIQSQGFRYCPRLLINMTKVGDGGSDFLARLLGRGGMDFDSDKAYRYIWIEMPTVFRAY